MSYVINHCMRWFCAIVLVLLSAILPLSCKRAREEPITVGTSKHVVLERLGDPHTWYIVKPDSLAEGSLQVVSYFSPGLAERPIPSDEMWLFEYENPIQCIWLMNEAVTNIKNESCTKQEISDTALSETTYPEQGTETITGAAPTSIQKLSSGTSEPVHLTPSDDLSVAAKLVLGHAQVTITKVEESKTTPIRKTPARPGMKFVFVEFKINKLKAGEELSSANLFLEGSSGKQYTTPIIYVESLGMEGEAGTALTATGAGDGMQVFFDVMQQEDVNRLRLGYSSAL